MPLVLVDVIRGHDEARLRELMDLVHDAVVTAFDVPDTDRYQILTQHEPFEIHALDTGLGFTRTRDLAIIRLVSKQRSEGAKQRLYELIAQHAESRLGISTDDLIVTIVENGAADWSFGQGVAQFLTGDLEQR